MVKLFLWETRAVQPRTVFSDAPYRTLSVYRSKNEQLQSRLSSNPRKHLPRGGATQYEALGRWSYKPQQIKNRLKKPVCKQS